MTERFNVAGALLVKLFGRPAVEDEEYAVRAATVRDIGCASRSTARCSSSRSPWWRRWPPRWSTASVA
jgi:hypothetical protein